ncbi:UNVERIFIED_CONTAM: hypothetical protein FKN15_043222 [Acipenser sinensis]
MPERQEPGPMREVRPTERRKREEELRPPEPEEAGQPLEEFLPSVQPLLLKPSLTFSDVMGLTRTQECCCLWSSRSCRSHHSRAVISRTSSV